MTLIGLADLGLSDGGDLEFMCPISLYEKCRELFTSYPLAVSAVNRSGTVRSMVLMLQKGDDTEYYVLSYKSGEGAPFYSLCPWPTGTIVDIEANGRAHIPGMFVNAVTRGIPIPRDGTLLGWKHCDTITALVAVYAEYAPATPEPCWSVMPLMGIPEEDWPPFTGGFIGKWFWGLYKTDKIVSVGDLIAGIPETVFWVNTKAIIDSDCCIVARNIRSSQGYTLQSGRYIYYKVLREARPVPSLRTLLADATKADLAPRFWQSLGRSWPEEEAEPTVLHSTSSK